MPHPLYMYNILIYEAAVFVYYQYQYSLTILIENMYNEINCRFRIYKM